MNTNMRRLLLFVGIGSLAFSLACGGGSNGGGFGSGGGGGTGNFSTASLNGHYAYQLKGYTLPSQTPFREAGVFTADGNGHVTSVNDDISTGTSSLNVGGSYQVNGDGSGTLTLNLTSGTATFELTLSSSSQFYMVETDSIANSGFVSSGTGQKQDSTALTTVPSGNFILRMHTIAFASNTANPQSTVGLFTIGGGTVTGNLDNQQVGGFTPSTINSGTFNTPDATGRGSGNFVDSVNGTLPFNYYVVDANHLIVFSTLNGTIGVGVAEKQSGSPFTAASFSGSYAFASNGDTGFFEGTNTVGRFSTDGVSAISAGALDNVTDGTASGNISFTGTYTVANNGRTVVTLNAGSNSIQQVYWLVSPTRAFFVTDSPNSIEDGSLDAQVGSFSNASLSGLYGFEMDGFDNSLGNTKQRVGIMNLNGSGTISLGEVSNALGVASSSGTLTGTYAVNSNGRVAGTVNNLSNNLVLYLVSGSQAYMLQSDTGVSIAGTMIKQQ